MKKIFLDKNVFDFLKLFDLIKFIVNFYFNKNVWILDFYVGLGIIGYVVMELNKEDGGNWSYILVINNENNIGIDVCYERLYCINNGIFINSEFNFDWIKKN